MGCCNSSSGDVPETKIEQDALAEFLQDSANLRKVWDVFNKDGNDIIDRAEFENLLYASLELFIKAQDPDAPVDRQQIEPFVKKLKSDLQPKIDVDGDQAITFEEFQKFGDYLKSEWDKIAEANA